jgi:hypothetical protein
LIHEVSIAECAREHPGRERDQGCCAENAEIEPIQGQIDFAEAHEHIVVVVPDNADIDERHRIGEIGWPFFQEFFDQLPRNGGRAVNLKNKQGDDDGEAVQFSARPDPTDSWRKARVGVP